MLRGLLEDTVFRMNITKVTSMKYTRSDLYFHRDYFLLKVKCHTDKDPPRAWPGSLRRYSLSYEYYKDNIHEVYTE